MSTDNLPTYYLMRKLLLSVSLYIISISCFAQHKIIDKFNRIFPDDTTRRNTFMPLPAISYNQEAGLIFGASALYSFYMDKHDRYIRPSQLTAVAVSSTKGQSQLSVKSDIWSKANQWHHIYAIQYYNLPFNFYGLGNQTFIADKDRLNQKRFRINAEVEKTLLKNYYTGIGAEFESNTFSDKEPGGVFETMPQKDREGGKFMMFKITQLYDSRNSNTYPTRGLFGRFKYGYTPDLFGKDQFTGSLFSADIRQFSSLSEKVVLASKFFYEGLQSNQHIPFYVLRQLGNDEVMRGYYQGRYRDKHYISLQSELRYRFSNRFGVVAFGGVGNVNNKLDGILSGLKPNYGIGGRFFFDLDKNLAVRFDYGMGARPTGEKRISGFYVSLSEAF